MQKLLTYLWGVYFFASSAVLACVATLITLFTFAFDPNRKYVHLFSCAWGFHYLFLSPFWQVKFEGKELIDPNKTYVFVANHQSFFDILVLYGLFHTFKWVSRDEIFKIPFVGTNMELNQYVKLVRGNMSSIKDMLKTCKSWIKKDASIMLFPEGTRSETGQIGQFRDGAFRLATECNVPIVPIVIDGTFKVFSKQAKVIDFTVPIKVKILPPVIADEHLNSTVKLRDYVHNLMESTLAEMRKPSMVPALDFQGKQL